MDKAKLVVEKLEASAAQELIEKIKDFSKYYNKFMKLSLPDCRSAEISSDDYMPLINNGDYKEASANVHKRFLYFVTLLQMSLVDDIPFPRLLLIDTPENIGIDNDNLKRMIGCLDALENPNNVDYQVILSTGVKKYPDSFKGNVILQLSKANKLLKQK
ncbi:TPA: ATP-binding protein, partial [Escherichia coli]|nr:ATP-binding protein [Escherichia coli]